MAARVLSGAGCVCVSALASGRGGLCSRMRDRAHRQWLQTALPGPGCRRWIGVYRGLVCTPAPRASRPESREGRARRAPDRRRSGRGTRTAGTPRADGGRVLDASRHPRAARARRGRARAPANYNPLGVDLSLIDRYQTDTCEQVRPKTRTCTPAQPAPRGATAASAPPGHLSQTHTLSYRRVAQTTTELWLSSPRQLPHTRPGS